MGLLAPWAQAGVVAAHELADYDHPQAISLAGLEVLVHGHGHTQATPSHSHAFAAPQPPLGRGGISMMPHLHPIWSSVPAAASQFEPRGSSARTPDGGFGVGPPPAASLFPILRI